MLGVGAGLYERGRQDQLPCHQGAEQPLAQFGRSEAGHRQSTEHESRPQGHGGGRPAGLFEQHGDLPEAISAAAVAFADR